MKVLRVSDHFKILRQESRKEKQVKAEQYLESISPDRFSLKKEMTRKSNLIL